MGYLLINNINFSSFLLFFLKFIIVLEILFFLHQIHQKIPQNAKITVGSLTASLSKLNPQLR